MNRFVFNNFMTYQKDFKRNSIHLALLSHLHDNEFPYGNDHHIICSRGRASVSRAVCL